jgi:hypothetical protein
VDRAISLRSRVRQIAQALEGRREVGLILRHDVEQILRQLAIAVAFLGEAEPAPESRVIGGLETRGEGVDRA